MAPENPGPILQEKIWRLRIWHKKSPGSAGREVSGGDLHPAGQSYQPRSNENKHPSEEFWLQFHRLSLYSEILLLYAKSLLNVYR